LLQAAGIASVVRSCLQSPLHFALREQFWLHFAKDSSHSMQSRWWPGEEDATSGSTSDRQEFSMTDTAFNTPSRHTLRTLVRARKHTVTIAIAVLVYAALSYAILASSGNPPLQFRLDVSPLLHSPWVLKAHVSGALSSFAIGSFLLLGVKGRRVHRIFGYGWVATMSLTAISSFFLVGLNGQNFSFIHAISAWAVIVLPMGVAAARRHDIKSHRKHMTGMFVGGMVVAGLFSFLPGRMMWSIFFGV
jgi:uncharacterized membrane protein